MCVCVCVRARASADIRTYVCMGELASIVIALVLKAALVNVNHRPRLIIYSFAKENKVQIRLSAVSLSLHACITHDIVETKKYSTKLFITRVSQRGREIFR